MPTCLRALRPICFSCSLQQLLVLLAAPDLLDVEVVKADAPLEEQRQQSVPHRVAEMGRPPLLVGGDPQDAVADIVVLAHHVGECVVDVIVRVLPLLGRLDRVPLPAARVDLGVVHPVPLAVHDVVADLDIFQDLCHGEQRGARHPRRRQRAREEGHAAGDQQPALQGDDAPDVLGVASAEVFLDLLADRIEAPAELLDLVLAQVGVLLHISDSHQCFRPPERSHRRQP